MSDPIQSRQMCNVEHPDPDLGAACDRFEGHEGPHRMGDLQWNDAPKVKAVDTGVKPAAPLIKTNPVAAAATTRRDAPTELVAEGKVMCTSRNSQSKACALQSGHKEPHRSADFSASWR